MTLASADPTVENLRVGMGTIRGAYRLKPWATMLAVSRRIGLKPCIQPIADVDENGGSELVTAAAVIILLFRSGPP